MYKKTIAIIITLISVRFAFAGSVDINKAVEKLENNETMVEAVKEIESIGSPAAKELKKLINNPNTSQGAKQVAIVMLGKIKSSKDRIYLEQILRSDKNIWNRDAAAHALGLLGQNNSIPELKKGLHDSSANVQLRTAWSLAKLGDNSGKDLALGALNNMDERLQALATDTLEVMNDSTIVPVLKENLKSSNPRTRECSMFAIKRIGVKGLTVSQKQQYLKEMLEDKQFEINSWAAIELVQDGTLEAIKILKETAGDKTIAGNRSAYEAVRLLIKQGKLKEEDISK